MAEDIIPLKEEIPSEGEIIYKNNRELFYSFDKKKNCYTQHVSYQYEANQVIIKQGWDELENRLVEIIKKINAGKLSPLAYFMERSQMDVTMLAQYSGIRKWRVRKHLVPKGFHKLSLEEKNQYAQALDISIDQLTNPEIFIQITKSNGKEVNG